MDTPEPLYDIVKPSFTDSQITELCSRLYGIEPIVTAQLSGYDDQNIWIKTCNNLKSNDNLHQIWPDGYVLKITNSKDSENVSLIEAQIIILQQLEKQSICAPIPVMNTNGKHFSLEIYKGEDGASSSHAIKLLTFQRGEILKDVEVSESLSRELGVFLFKLNNCLKLVHHASLMNRDFLFMLDKVPALRAFLPMIKDKRKVELVSLCIQEFEDHVMTNINQLEKGIIHGDYNEQNILVENSRVSAVLDFNDCQYAPYIFDLAIGISYLIILTKNFKMIKQFIIGYTEYKKLTTLEEKILLICVRSRICQSLVLGIHAHSLNPSNEYILSTQKNGWEALELLQDINFNSLIK